MKWSDEDAAVASIAAHKLIMSKKFKTVWRKGPAKNFYCHRLDKEIALNEIKHFSAQKSSALFKNLNFTLKAESIK